VYATYVCLCISTSFFYRDQFFQRLWGPMTNRNIMPNHLTI